MKVLQSWVESLAVLKPKSFKLFLLVTLKSVVGTYKILFTKFWPILLAFVVLDYGILYACIFFPILALAIIRICMVAIMLFLVFLAARPSVQQKDWPYIQGYWKQFLFFLLYCIMITLIFNKISLLTIFLFMGHVFIVSPLFVVTNGFLLDSDGSIKSAVFSLWRGIKFCVFNYPFCLLGFIFFYCFFYALNLFGIWYLSMLLWPLPICFFINFYIKRLHEQFDVYFEQKGS